MVLFAIDTLTEKALNKKSKTVNPIGEEEIKRKYINKIWQLMGMKKASPSSRDYDLWVTSQQMLKSAIVAHLPATS